MNKRLLRASSSYESSSSGRPTGTKVNNDAPLETTSPTSRSHCARSTHTAPQPPFFPVSLQHYSHRFHHRRNYHGRLSHLPLTNQIINMRAEIATLAVALGLVGCANAVTPTYSCFDPPGEGQTNPLGEGMEDVVEDECCEALMDESDILSGRMVVWDPVNCNHGPGDLPIAEAPLCRAHDTDGCRFCRESCDDFEGLCLTCSDVIGFSDTAGPTSSPTSTPFGFFSISSGDTPAPFGLFPNTPAPRENPDGNGQELGGGFRGGLVEDCQCLDDISEVEAAVLLTQGKTLMCDSTCLDGTDFIWGVMNCNYFGLGQDCRACAEPCTLSEAGSWLDDEGNFCKPCSAIIP